MALQQLVLLLTVLVSIVDCDEATHYFLDSVGYCQPEGILTKTITDNEIIKIHGKHLEYPDFKICKLAIVPSERATKLSMKIMFETYHNNECGVYLAMQQSPYQVFEKEVSTMFNLSCFVSPGKTAFYTDAGNTIRIILQKRFGRSINYNFVFNISLTDHDETQTFSSGIIIAIGTIIAISIPAIGCIVYRYLKIKRWSKQQEELSSTLHPMQSGSNLSESTSPPIRYSSMPHMTSMSQSHACVLDTEGPGGVCTMCHTRHEDFAHVVDVVDDSSAQRHGISQDNFHVTNSCSTPRICGTERPDGICTVCNNRHEDFAHVVDVVDDRSDGRHRHRSHEDLLQAGSSRSSPRSRPQRPAQRRSQPSNDAMRVVQSAHNTPTQSAGFLSHPTSAQAVQAPVDSAWSSDDDNDIDLSSNDLIPPSYDLSPPSYDEAVSMPKPGKDFSTGALLSKSPSQHNEESDPLYQNIGT